MSENWHPLTSVEDFPPEGKHTAIINGWHVLAVKTSDGFFAMNDRCTHQASHLSTGRIRRDAVMCPLHGARFEIATGKCLGGTYKPLRTFPLRVADGMIQISLPAHTPDPDDLPIAIG